MIDLIASPDQQDVADTLASFLSEQLPVERHRSDVRGNKPHDFQRWQGFADIACFSLSLPEEQGGVGMSLAEETIAFREYGRSLVSPSMLGTVLAVRVAAHAALPQLAAVMADLIAGKRRAAVANPVNASIGPSVSGELQLLDWRRGDLVVVWNDAGVALLDAASITTSESIRPVDGSVTMDLVQLTDVKPLAWVAADVLPLPAIATLLISAMLVGITESVRDMAVAYAQTRVQFGKPIGSYQAVKHRCVDIALDAEVAWSQTVYAALTLASGLPDAPFQVATAKLIANSAALKGVRQNIQVHGGIGFTAELNANLYLKRAHLWSELGGNSRAQQRHILALDNGVAA